MKNSKTFSVYIMGNNRPTLYTGMTSDLRKRVYQHKNELVAGFTKKYHLHKLFYYECYETAMQSIIREKQIKNMKRSEKLALIKEKNPLFEDLANTWDE